MITTDSTGETANNCMLFVRSFVRSLFLFVCLSYNFSKQDLVCSIQDVDDEKSNTDMLV
jgi:hypothetical protein